MSSLAPAAHLTVLAAPAVEHLVTDPHGVYVDATFGRGGHAKLILERLPARGRLIALDRDPQAAAAAAAIADPRFHFVHTHPDGSITNHQFGMNEFGVIGKVIV